MSTLYIGCDHAGLSLKNELLPRLKEAFPKWALEDQGTFAETSVDYPNFARVVAEKVSANKDSKGLLICGSGLGMAIAANKVSGIRAVVAWDVTSARLSREHNDANVLCLGGRLTGREVALEACRTWLTTEFAGGRHTARLQLIQQMEGK